MVLSKNLLIAFSFAIFFLISNVHCIDIIPGTRILLWHLILVVLIYWSLNFNIILFIIIWTGTGIKMSKICYDTVSCAGDGAQCRTFCTGFKATGVCISEACCCIFRNKILK